MFEWLRRPKGPEQPNETDLKLGTGDRPFFASTTNSETLARELLAQAQEKAKKLEAGEEVTVDVKELHPYVHHMELMMSLTRLASDYGLRVQSQFNNSHTFQKI